MTEETKDLPKKIWFLWLQGREGMPEVVQKCYDSWKRYNPGWEIVFLDEKSLPTLLDLDAILYDRQSDIPRVSVSEIVRINLLTRHGGVWVDATCFCCQPLEEWLTTEVAKSGFFAFSRPGADRMISSWFMAALPGNELVRRYAQTVNAFWTKYKQLVFISDKPILHKIVRRSGLHSWLYQHPPRWFHWVFQSLFQVYPYYWFHYTFEKLYHQDSAFKAIWDQTPQLTADRPHLCWNHGLSEPADEELKERIQNLWAPVYKLTWKVNDAMFVEDRTLHYLLYKSGF